MCNGIAIIVVKRNDDEIKVYCDPTNGSHDKLLSENVPVEYHNSYIKVEYIFPGELRLDCPDTECRKAALITGLVDEIFPNVLRISPQIIEIIAKNIPKVESWPKELMQFANLQNADLRSANLRSANLQNADLRSANLWNANLQNANLQGADLRSADLQNANLRNADLRYADLPEPVGGRFDPAKIKEYREKLRIIINEVD